MALSLRSYEPHDFSALHKLDQSCFPPGISYSKTALRYFLTLASADCVVAIDENHIVGFIVSEENPPLAHIIKSWNPILRRGECGRSCWKLQLTTRRRLPSGSAAAIVSRLC